MFYKSCRCGSVHAILCSFLFLQHICISCKHASQCVFWSLFRFCHLLYLSKKACFKTVSTWPWLCMCKPFTNLRWILNVSSPTAKTVGFRLGSYKGKFVAIYRIIKLWSLVLTNCDRNIMGMIPFEEMSDSCICEISSKQLSYHSQVDEYSSSLDAM